MDRSCACWSGMGSYCFRPAIASWADPFFRSASGPLTRCRGWRSPMDKALRMAASTGRRPCRHCTYLPTPSKQDGRFSRVSCGTARPRTRLAAPADALDLFVEGGVFLAERIVRIAYVFLVGHVADARLAVADRRRRNALILHCGR